MAITNSYLDHGASPSNTSPPVFENMRAVVQYEAESRFNAYTEKCPPALKMLLELYCGEYQPQKNQNRDSFETKQAVTVKEMVEKIRTVFGLNAVQVATISEVSRPSLYNHISGKEVPKDMASYQSLFELALLIERKVEVDISRGLKTVLVDGFTLLEHLKQKPLDQDFILTVAQRIKSKIQNSQQTPLGLSISEQRSKSRSLTKAG